MQNPWQPMFLQWKNGMSALCPCTLWMAILNIHVVLPSMFCLCMSNMNAGVLTLNRYYWKQLPVVEMSNDEVHFTRHTHTKTLTLDSLWYQSYCQRSSLSITEGRVNSGAVCCLISKTCGHEEANIKSQKHIHSGEIHKNAPPNVIVISSPFVFPPQFVSLSASGRIFWAVLITRGSCLCEPLRLFAAKDNKFFNTQRDTNLGKHKLEAPQDFYVMKVIDRITV